MPVEYLWQRNRQSCFTVSGGRKLFHKNSRMHLYKREGNSQVSDNISGVSLQSIAGKILANILLNRLNVHLGQKEISQKVNVDSEKT